MKVTMTKDEITIKIPRRTAALSKSGKSIVLATTEGNTKTDQKVNGEQVVVGLNVYVPVTDATKSLLSAPAAPAAAA